MRRRWIVPVAVSVLAVVGGLAGKVLLAGGPSGGRDAAPAADGAASLASTAAPSRIVSLAPSVTEMIYALGLEERLVGVTRYCAYPPEVAEKPKIGGYSDPSCEAVLALAPDLVIMLVEHEEPRKAMEAAGVPHLVLDNRSVEGILGALQKIGAACGVPYRAEEIVTDLRRRMAEISGRTAGLPRPRVMVVVGRNMGSGSIRDVYVCGNKGYFEELIVLAGGTNAYQGPIAFPAVSKESILKLDPEVIIDLVPDLEVLGLDARSILKEWEDLGRVRAVAAGRVFVVSEGYGVVPGPRFILLLERLAEAIHPELEGSGP